MKLIDYIKPITSSECSWITSLTLSNIGCSRTDLIQLSQLINIGTLTIGPNVQVPDIGIDDSIIRSWARIAVESQAFRVFRVLSLRSQKEITSTIFTHLTQFPSLAIINFEDSNLGPQDKPLALLHGWTYGTSEDLGWRIIEGRATSTEWDFVMQVCFQLGGRLCTEARTKEDVRAIDDLPALHLALGSAPASAGVEKARNLSLQCFYRLKRDILQCKDSERASNKRILAEVQPHGPRKKLTVRASKQQNLEDLLSGFGG